eukprot:Unigene6388_Nuclearia_a/m.19688 Unigene6388_Nuclearia_a/g.19688  ORF Unigene6388_Nuclearia_a/g.19688 Unigene6388_Nuclearia_a/m.19688 type:complete len:312 (-) Unigene6388_Nuclearia_a:485-1420(-)
MGEVSFLSLFSITRKPVNRSFCSSAAREPVIRCDSTASPVWSPPLAELSGRTAHASTRKPSIVRLRSVAWKSAGTVDGSQMSRMLSGAPLVRIAYCVASARALSLLVGRTRSTGTYCTTTLIRRSDESKSKRRKIASACELAVTNDAGGNKIVSTWRGSDGSDQTSFASDSSGGGRAMKPAMSNSDSDSEPSVRAKNDQPVLRNICTSSGSPTKCALRCSIVYTIDFCVSPPAGDSSAVSSELIRTALGMCSAAGTALDGGTFCSAERPWQAASTCTMPRRSELARSAGPRASALAPANTDLVPRLDIVMW